jgi:methylenetetrahydrofolate reductase (NADPH)
MKVTQHIEAANGETLFSLKLFRHKRESIQELYDNIDPLMEFKPPFIDVTTSREDLFMLIGNGLLDKKLTRMRPGTLGFVLQ